MEALDVARIKWAIDDIRLVLKRNRQEIYTPLIMAGGGYWQFLNQLNKLEVVINDIDTADTSRVYQQEWEDIDDV